MRLESYLNQIVKFIQTEVKNANAQGVIVGVSGGIDSSVVALLAKKAFPDNHLVLLMPCFSPAIDEEYAQDLVKKHHLNAKTISLNDTFVHFKATLDQDLDPKKAKLILGNLKARLRMTTLYAYSQNYNYLVLGTDNADEWHIGYFTKYGDGGSDLLPIVHLLKHEVFAAAKILGVNDEIIVRTPTAGLWDGQTDEQEMQFSYHELDQYLLGEHQKVSRAVQKRITQMHESSQHKRKAIPQPPKWERS